MSPPTSPAGPGQLLVATPDLDDPNFRRAVVLLLAHGEEGTLGVIVNRPGELAVGDVLPGLEREVADPAVVFVGGPVQPDGVIALARTVDELEGVGPVAPGLGVVDLDRDDPVVPTGVRTVRLFAGHAGWGAGQLDDEVAAGGWFVVAGEADDAFARAPDRLWERVLRRQGGLFTTATATPSTN